MAIYLKGIILTNYDWEEDYLHTLLYIIKHGIRKTNRTGVDTLSTFDTSYTVNLQETFPAITTKKLQWKSVVSELLWFLEGSTDERRLAEIHYGNDRKNLIGKKTIWTANADKQGKELGYVNTNTTKELGPIYGYQWRNWGGDQLQKVLNNIKNDPNDRRHIVSAWNVADLDKMALPPCHNYYQLYVDQDTNTISMKYNMRSNDMFLGNCFNTASYALLLHMIADYLGMNVGTLIYTCGDAHVYVNHLDAINTQLSRIPYKNKIKLDMPKIESFDIEYIQTLKVDDFKLVDYVHHPAITAPMAV